MRGRKHEEEINIHTIFHVRYGGHVCRSGCVSLSGGITIPDGVTQFGKHHASGQRNEHRRVRIL